MAIARPMPLEAPVTTATLPSSLTPPPLRGTRALTSQIPTYQGLSISQGSADAAVGECAVGGGGRGRPSRAGRTSWTPRSPRAGSLGAVSGRVLREIAGACPPAMPFSVALGEPRNAAALEAAMAVLHGLGPRPGRVYVKIGLSAAGDRGRGAARGAGRRWRRGRRSGRRSSRSHMRITWRPARPPPRRSRAWPRPRAPTAYCSTPGARTAGICFITWPSPRFARGSRQARAAGLLVALAGSLSVGGRPGGGRAAGGHRRRSRGGLYRRAGGVGERGPGGASSKRRCLGASRLARSGALRARRCLDGEAKCRSGAHRALRRAGEVLLAQRVGHVQPGHSTCQIQGLPLVAQNIARSAANAAGLPLHSTNEPSR